MSRYTRRARKRDANEPEIVRALQAIGATVERLDVIDLLVGYRGRNYLLEVKDPARLRDHKAHRERQIAWRLAWKGEAVEVTTAGEAIRAITGQIIPAGAGPE